MQHFSLHFDGYWPVIRTIAMTVARSIKSDDPISIRNRNVEARPILTRTGITMKQDDGLSLALYHKVKIGPVDIDENRFCARMIVRDTAGDVTLLKSTGNFHDLNS